MTALKPGACTGLPVRACRAAAAPSAGPSATALVSADTGWPVTAGPSSSDADLRRAHSPTLLKAPQGVNVGGCVRTHITPVRLTTPAWRKQSARSLLHAGAACEGRPALQTLLLAGATQLAHMLACAAEANAAHSLPVWPGEQDSAPCRGTLHSELEASVVQCWDVQGPACSLNGLPLI